jgi:hypothetical protein
LKRFDTIWKIRGVRSSLGGNACTSPGNTNSFSTLRIVAAYLNYYSS